MNIYILINSRKIRNKDKSNLSYLKIPLKDIKTEKKYSTTIVNDIKIAFTIKVASKSMNHSQTPSDKKNIIIKPKTVNISNISTIDNDKLKKPQPLINSPFSAIKRTLRAATLSNQNRSASTAVKPTKSQALLRAHKIEEKLEVQPSNRKKTILEKEKKREYNKRPQVPGSASQKIQPVKASEDAVSRSRLKTINTQEIFLNPINYEKYLIENNPKNKNTKHRETFCEGFFIASFPQKDGQVVEKSQSFPASCGHKDCSSLPAMKPEILLRYPLEDTKTLELNNLAATICFPTGIKVCYSENEPEMIKDYVTPITNQKGERYYMMTFHFYLKMENDIYSKNY